MFTDRDREVLDFEGRVWATAAVKENAILTEFGWTPARYYQAVRKAAAEPDALEHNPMLIHRLVDAEVTRARKRRTKTL